MWKNRRCRASFLQRRSGQVPALEERRVGCLPRAPARHPAGRLGAGTALRPRAWRRSPRASLLGCLGLLFTPVREARRLCPGMAGGCGRGRKGLPHWPNPGLKDHWAGQEPVGALWSFKGTAPAAERLRLVRGAGAGRCVPRGWTPSCGHR